MGNTVCLTYNDVYIFLQILTSVNELWSFLSNHSRKNSLVGKKVPFVLFFKILKHLPETDCSRLKSNRKLNPSMPRSMPVFAEVVFLNSSLLLFLSYHLSQVSSYTSFSSFCPSYIPLQLSSPGQPLPFVGYFFCCSDHLHTYPKLPFSQRPSSKPPPLHLPPPASHAPISSAYSPWKLVVCSIDADIWLDHKLKNGLHVSCS